MTRWVIRILAGLLVLVCVAVAVIYIASSRYINKRYAFHAHPVTVPTDSASIAEGARMARIRCIGCHGDSLRGRVFYDEPNIARLIAPNVPSKLATLTDAEFAGFLRSGVRKDGTSPFIMPPPGFYHISDADLGSLIAYLRSLPVDTTPLPRVSYRILGRLGVLLGQFKTAVSEYDTTMERVGQDPAWATTRHGEYLARLICTECHGLRLTGDSTTPNLSGAVGYSPQEFVRLLRNGVPRDSAKTLGLMGETARKSLTWFRDEEIASVYEYLKALPTTGVK